MKAPLIWLQPDLSDSFPSTPLSPPHPETGHSELSVGVGAFVQILKGAGLESSPSRLPVTSVFLFLLLPSLACPSPTPAVEILLILQA